MKFYERAICNLDIPWAIDNGWAAPWACKLSTVPTLDLSQIRMSGADFNQASLIAECDRDSNLHRIALITSEEMEGPTVVFTPSVAGAKGVSHYLTNNYGIESVLVYGTQPEEERIDALQRFKSGRAPVLVNCQVVAVGFDHPPVRCLVLGRPTRSRSFWLQCIGRATRPLPGTVDFVGSTPESRKAAIAASAKPRFKIVDCTTASLDHRLITAVDMFCDFGDEVKDRVKRAIADGEPLTQEELDALAQKELEKRQAAQEAEARRKLMVGRARGMVIGEEIDLRTGGRRCVGTYMNPLKGKYAGCRMNQLPDWYIAWACQQHTIKGWIKSTFTKERARRHGLARAV